MSTPSTSEVGIIFITVVITAVFWSSYEYRVMPKLEIAGKRRWRGITSTTDEMESIDEEAGSTGGDNN